MTCFHTSCQWDYYIYIYMFILWLNLIMHQVAVHLVVKVNIQALEIRRRRKRRGQQKLLEEQKLIHTNIHGWYVQIVVIIFMPIRNPWLVCSDLLLIHIANTNIHDWFGTSMQISMAGTFRLLHTVVSCNCPHLSLTLGLSVAFSLNIETHWTKIHRLCN